MRIKTIRKSWLFWMALFGPLLLSAISAALISYWIKDVYFFSVSSVENFKNFYEIFKIPLGLLTASPLTAGIAAVVHRSEETAEQIKISETKNNFDIYIKHREIFFSDIDVIVSSSDHLFVNFSFKVGLNKDYIYSLFFSGNTYYDFKEYQSKRNSNDIFKEYLDFFSSYASGECFQPGYFKSVIESLGIYLISTVDGSEVMYQKHRDIAPIMNFMSLLHKQLGNKYCKF